MDKSSVFFVALIVLSCGISDGNILGPGYFLDERAGGWLKFHRLPMNWEQASFACHFEGAVLASPTDTKTSEALKLLMLEHGVTHSPIFTGIRHKVSCSVQQFTEGNPETNTNIQVSENCVGMNADGTLAEDLSCLDKHPFACFLEKDDTLASPPECGTPVSGYVLNNRTGSCYKVYQHQHKWSDASMICAAQGGHLAVINSQYEAEVIWELANTSLSQLAVLIGFRSVNEQSFEGLFPRNWTTVQGQSLEEAGYARWFKGEPNSYNENCGSVIFSGSIEDGILNDAPCDMDLMFICEIETKTLTSNTPTSSPTTTTWTPDTPTDTLTVTKPTLTATIQTSSPTTPTLTTQETYQKTEVNKKSWKQGVVNNVSLECDTLDKEYVLDNRTGSCYKVHQDKRNWTQAADVCSEEGGYLAVINSQEEAQVLWELTKKSKAQYSIFIGFKASGNTWVTVQGETLEDAGYNSWDFGEPSYSGEYCGGLNGYVETGVLNNVGCEVVLMFICEIRP